MSNETKWEEPEPTVDEEKSEANTALGTGLGIGAFGLASATLLGAVCPMCVVAAPALIGYGVFKRMQCSTRAKVEAAEAEAADAIPTGDDLAGGAAG